MNTKKEKTLSAEQFGDSREEGNRNTYQGDPMDTTVPRIPVRFDTTIHVAGLTVSPFFEHGFEVALSIEGDEPGNLLEFTPAEACALAAALQAVAVHVMEQNEEAA